MFSTIMTSSYDIVKWNLRQFLWNLIYFLPLYILVECGCSLAERLVTEAQDTTHACEGPGGEWGGQNRSHQNTTDHRIPIFRTLDYSSLLIITWNFFLPWQKLSSKFIRNFSKSCIFETISVTLGGFENLDYITCGPEVVAVGFFLPLTGTGNCTRTATVNQSNSLFVGYMGSSAKIDTRPIPSPTFFSPSCSPTNQEPGTGYQSYRYCSSGISCKCAKSGG